MLLTGWLAFLVAGGLAQASSPPAAQGCSTAPSGAVGLAGDLERFRGLLTATRHADESVEVELVELAEHLGSTHGRDDCSRVARHYLGLLPSERQQGVVDEQAYLLLRQEAERASRGEVLEGRSLREAYAEIIAQLIVLAERVRPRSDWVPAAQAFAFAARLQVDLAESQGAGRAELLNSANAHTQIAIDLFERAGQRTPQIEPLWVRGRIERARGAWAESEQAFVRCAELARRVPSVEYELHALMGLIALARDRGDVHTVDRLIAQAAQLTSPREYWPLAREHAVRLLHADRAPQALEFLERCRPAQGYSLDEWHALRGAAHLRRMDLVSARRAMAALEDPSQSELLVLVRASIELASKNPEAVIDALREPLAQGTFSILGNAQGASLFGEAYLDLGEYESAALWLEEALERAGSWAALQADPSPGSVFGEWIGLHTVVLLAEAHARSGRVLRAAAVVEALQSRTLRRHPGFVEASADEGSSTELELFTEADLLAWASRYELGLTTWCIGSDRSIAFHLEPDGQASVTYLERGRREIEMAVRRLREAAAEGNEARARKLGRELSAELLPATLVERLAGADAQARALFLLHGPLERAPLALFFLGEQPLVERCTPLVLPGLPELPAGSSSASKTLAEAEWHLCGAPSGSDQRQLLPGAARELSALARIYPRARLSSGSSFTAEALTAALRSGAPLHIATHLVHSDACDSARLAPLALQLADGALFCAADVRKLAPCSPLVVLSTCESAEGIFVDAEGLQGLTRAFLESGTQNLLVTLWPVEDGAAARAAELFHEALGRGLTPSRAAQSMTTGLAQEGYPLADWSAYRLIGGE